MSASGRMARRLLTLMRSPSAILWRGLDVLNRRLRTGVRRFEFERLYQANPDPWSYHSSDYEREKYDRTLACALRLCSRTDRALELGCSVGAFTSRLAGRFSHVTGVDISRWALKRAAANTAGQGGIEFRRGDLAALKLGRRYDLITCAEVLYYIPRTKAAQVCDSLERHLEPDGVIITVSRIPGEHADPLDVEGWEEILATRFSRVFCERVERPPHAFQLNAFKLREPRH